MLLRYMMQIMIILSFSGNCFAEVFSKDQVAWTNWTLTESTTYTKVFYPKTRNEIIQVVKQASLLGKPLKVIGSSYSPNAIALADKDGWVLSLEAYNRAHKIDVHKRTIIVEAGMTLLEIQKSLQQKGFSLENLPTVSNQTIAGAISTGTHGTGFHLGALHTQVQSLTLINSVGRLKKLSRTTNTDLFLAALCGLGSLGVIDTIELRIVPDYHMQVSTFASSWPQILDGMDKIGNEHHWLKFFWFPYTPHVGVWGADPVGTDQKVSPEVVSAEPGMSPLATMMAQKGVKTMDDLWEIAPQAPKYIKEVNTAFFSTFFGTPNKNRIQKNVDAFTIPLVTKFDVMEVAVYQKNCKNFLLELSEAIHTQGYPAHAPIEVRFVKSDDAYLSTAYSKTEELFCYVNLVVNRPNQKGIVNPDKYFTHVNQIAQKYAGRVHWAKMNEVDAKYFLSAYPMFENFKKIRQQEDPRSLFLNPFLRKVFAL